MNINWHLLTFFFSYETSCFLKTEMDSGLLSRYDRKRTFESQYFINISSRLDGFANWRMTLGTGSKLQIWHLSSQVKFTLITNQWVSHDPWRSSLSSFHWLVLCIYAHVQLKMLLINGFIGSCIEKTMSSPGMCSLNTSPKLGHVKVAVFISETTCFTKSSGYSKDKADICLRPCTGVHFYKPIQCDPRKEVLVMTSSQRAF